MSENRRRKNKKTVTPLYKTLALADVAERDPETGVTKASDIAVEAAKNWVDQNKL